MTISCKIDFTHGRYPLIRHRKCTGRILASNLSYVLQWEKVWTKAMNEDRPRCWQPFWRHEVSTARSDVTDGQMDEQMEEWAN